MSNTNTNPDVIEVAELPARDSAEGYTEWRAAAELRLDGLVRSYWEKMTELDALNRQIIDLRHVMGNGASGGTAWRLKCNQINK